MMFFVRVSYISRPTAIVQPIFKVVLRKEDGQEYEAMKDSHFSVHQTVDYVVRRKVTSRINKDKDEPNR